MNKELEALKRIKSHYNDRVCIDILEDFDLIESALKRLETLEEEKQSFDRQLEKKLKALEIIKEKSVDVGFLQWHSSVDSYNSYIVEHAWTKHTRTLTQGEFDLLKEVLEN